MQVLLNLLLWAAACMLCQGASTQQRMAVNSGTIHTRTSGSSRRLQAAGGDVHPWATLLGNSFLFYEAQQSGVLPSWNRVRRAAGGFRDDSHTTDGQDVGMDAVGSFHDAGDHVKYTLPMSAAMATLGLGALMHEDGYRAAGQWDAMSRNLLWGAQYLSKVFDPSSGSIVTQVGDTGTDHSYWGRPEQQTGYRPTKRQAVADVLGNAAATLAAVSMIISKPGGSQDTAAAAAFLQRAKQMLAAGDRNPGTYSDAAYSSSGYRDELALGYLMVCWADLTNGQGGLPQTCSTAMDRYTTAKGSLFYSANWDWDNQFFAASALLQLISTKLTAANGGTAPGPVSDAANFMSRTLGGWQDTSKACPSTPFDGTFQVCYSSGGLAFLTKWGTLRHTCNVAFAATLQAKALANNNDLAGARRQRCWARSQLMYAAGSNPKQQSYVVGYTPSGTKAADRPHHRAASCDPNFSVTCDWNAFNNPGPNPSVLTGALVGGPDNTDTFSNQRGDYVQNEVALDYNSGFTGALAGLSILTARLSSAGCSWNTYCNGGCDTAADSATVSPAPATPVVKSPPPASPAPTTSDPPEPYFPDYPASPAPATSDPPEPYFPDYPAPPPTVRPSPPPRKVSPSPSPPQSPRAPRTPSNPPGCPTTSPSPASPSSDDTCKQSVPSTKAYACDQCLAASLAGPMLSVCLSCPAQTYQMNTEWGCTQVCTNPSMVSSVGVATACVDCLASSPDGGSCQSCLSNTGTNVQKVACLSCLKTASDRWACAQCLGAKNVNACLSCVANNTQPGWQCVQNN